MNKSNGAVRMDEFRKMHKAAYQQAFLKGQNDAQGREMFFKWFDVEHNLTNYQFAEDVVAVMGELERLKCIAYDLKLDLSKISEMQLLDGTAEKTQAMKNKKDALNLVNRHIHHACMKIGGMLEMKKKLMEIEKPPS